MKNSDLVDHDTQSWLYVFADGTILARFMRPVQCITLESPRFAVYHAYTPEDMPNLIKDIHEWRRGVDPLSFFVFPDDNLEVEYLNSLHYLYSSTPVEDMVRVVL